MYSSGRYVLRYEPSDSEHEYLQTTVEMSISDEATLDDMANFFDAFLKASGYVYDGTVKVVKDVAEKAKPKTYTINDTVISGGSRLDTISFAGARPAMEFGAKSWDDVISFG